MLKKICIIASLVLMIKNPNAFATCYRNSPYLCHTASSHTETVTCLTWTTRNGELVQVPIYYYNQPWSETDGNRGLNCDSNGSLAYCRPDSIPNGCSWSRTSMICDELTSTPTPHTGTITGTINTTIAGGPCE